MTIIDTPVDNGVNTEALLSAREALSETPEAADFVWKARCSWVNGTFTQTTVDGFSGLGQDHHHKQPSTFDADHPECFASEDRGASPTEILLAALASCLTAGVASVAQHRQIQLKSVTAHVEGKMNVLGVLGADPDVRNGFTHLNVRFDIDADASPEDIQALVAQSQKRSAVYDSLTNPTNVTVTVG
jgi:uncharacterized OsmC-like protein